MNCITWGQLKAEAEEAGIRDDAPFLLETGEDDGDLKGAEVGVYCPIEGVVAKDGHDYTGFFIIDLKNKQSSKTNKA